MRKIKVGDEVQVITGKDKGKRGVVQEYYSDRNRVKVSGVNVLVKHKAGGTVTAEGTIHLSNVLHYSSKLKKPVRVGFEIKSGKKIRVLKKTGEVVKEPDYKKGK